MFRSHYSTNRSRKSLAYKFLSPAFKSMVEMENARQQHDVTAPPEHSEDKV
jgi:hypothetical protein